MALLDSQDRRPVTVRQDLLDAIERAWQHLARPGTWWTGVERLQMVAETRMAASCPLCRQRKAALSPYTVSGDHHALSELPDVVVEVVHRIATDAGRLTERWLQTCLDNGLTDSQYVEIVGLVATITALDTFAKALGEPPRTLPEPLPGPPTKRRPQRARKSIAWVPTVAPGDFLADEDEPYSRFGAVHIQQALSLVPESVSGFFDLDTALYLPQDAIRDFGNEYRAISHAQLEFIAAKASAFNGCYY